MAPLSATNVPVRARFVRGSRDPARHSTTACREATDPTSATISKGNSARGRYGQSKAMSKRNVVRTPGSANHDGAPDNLVAHSIRNSAVTVTAQLATIGLRLASVSIMARLLTPEDHGLVAMVTAMTGFAA